MNRAWVGDSEIMNAVSLAPAIADAGSTGASGKLATPSLAERGGGTAVLIRRPDGPTAGTEKSWCMSDDGLRDRPNPMHRWMPSAAVRRVRGERRPRDASAARMGLAARRMNFLFGADLAVLRFNPSGAPKVGFQVLCNRLE